ncbi:unnamed protein product [Caenorhabditis angaria]|uniref:Uncharacterized protein n=1 Tax=Caenorhabditis angaria TaxID=860376 RepID=A0A9P1MZF8_9PELO|nr:unnamed protein product [Caenorhabditis angaria]
MGRHSTIVPKKTRLGKRIILQHHPLIMFPRMDPIGQHVKGETAGDTDYVKLAKSTYVGKTQNRIAGHRRSVSSEEINQDRNKWQNIKNRQVQRHQRRRSALEKQGWKPTEDQWFSRVGEDLTKAEVDLSKVGYIGEKTPKFSVKFGQETSAEDQCRKKPNTSGKEDSKTPPTVKNIVPPRKMTTPEEKKEEEKMNTVPETYKIAGLIIAATRKFSKGNQIELRRWIEHFEQNCYAVGGDNQTATDLLPLLLEDTARIKYDLIPDGKKKDWITLIKTLLATHGNSTDTMDARETLENLQQGIMSCAELGRTVKELCDIILNGMPASRKEEITADTFLAKTRPNLRKYLRRLNPKPKTLEESIKAAEREERISQMENRDEDESHDTLMAHITSEFEKLSKNFQQLHQNSSNQTSEPSTSTNGEGEEDEDYEDEEDYEDYDEEEEDDDDYEEY